MSLAHLMCCTLDSCNRLPSTTEPRLNMNVGVAHSELNPNSSWLNSKGTWITYVIITLTLHFILLSLPFLTTSIAWTLTNVIHNCVSPRTAHPHRPTVHRSVPFPFQVRVLPVPYNQGGAMGDIGPGQGQNIHVLGADRRRCPVHSHQEVLDDRTDSLVSVCVCVCVHDALPVAFVPLIHVSFFKVLAGQLLHEIRLGSLFDQPGGHAALAHTQAAHIPRSPTLRHQQVLSLVSHLHLSLFPSTYTISRQRRRQVIFLLFSNSTNVFAISCFSTFSV
jgi:hypothetical protein